jgi:heme exporter protein A
MLQIDHLTCSRGDRQLFSDLSFSMAEGTLLYLQGRNGSGKTTLMRALCGLFLPESGDIRWRGEDIRKLQETYRRELCYLGHHNGLKDELTAVENLRITTALSGTQIDLSTALAALEKMGLYGYEDLPTKVLSQGQKRRVALARLLLTEATLWILDEPFTALDTVAVSHLEDVITERIRNGGIVILTTHQNVSLPSEMVQHLRLGH